MEEFILHVFCDGSSGYVKKNKESTYQTGVGVYFENTDTQISENCSQFLGGNLTNIRAELFAILVSIQELLNNPEMYEFIPGKNKVIIHTDSLYSIMTLTSWAPKWEKNDWKLTSSTKEAKNIDLIKDILELIRDPRFQSQPLQFEHIKGHGKEPINYGSRIWKNWYGNKTADHLASMGRLGISLF